METLWETISQIPKIWLVPITMAFLFWVEDLYGNYVEKKAKDHWERKQKSPD